MAKQRLNITSDIYGGKKHDVLEKMIAPASDQQTEEQPQPVSQEPAAPVKPAGGRTLKQAAFAIGTDREAKLDELVFTYNRQKGTRIGRNDIIRYIIDTLTLDDLLRVDLRGYRK